MDDMLEPREVAERYNVSANRGRQLVREWLRRRGHDAPAVIEKSRRYYVLLTEIQAWEAYMRSIGAPLPGERPRGPRRKK